MWRVYPRGFVESMAQFQVWKAVKVIFTREKNKKNIGSDKKTNDSRRYLFE